MTLQIKLERNAAGRLVFTAADGSVYTGVVPVRAFPLAAPEEGLSLMGSDGHELAWIERLDLLDTPMRTLIQEELALREFTPEIRRLKSVSSFGTPSVWAVETDRGDTTLVLEGEEDIRRLTRNALLIASASGVLFRVADLAALDRGSRKLLERFL